jgi:hypothetical protein
MCSMPSRSQYRNQADDPSLVPVATRIAFHVAPSERSFAACSSVAVRAGARLLGGRLGVGLRDHLALLG